MSILKLIQEELKTHSILLENKKILDNKHSDLFNEYQSLQEQYLLFCPSFSQINYRDEEKNYHIPSEEFLEQLTSSEIELSDEMKENKKRIIDSLKSVNDFYKNKLLLLHEKINNIKEEIRKLDKEIYELSKKNYNNDSLFLVTISKKSVQYSEEEINFIKSFEFVHEDDKRFYILQKDNNKEQFMNFYLNIKQRVNRSYLFSSRFYDRLKPIILKD